MSLARIIIFKRLQVDQTQGAYVHDPSDSEDNDDDDDDDSGTSGDEVSGVPARDHALFQMFFARSLKRSSLSGRPGRLRHPDDGHTRQSG